MPLERNRGSGVIGLALALGWLASGSAGCALFGASESNELPPPPATIVEVRAAIEAERAQLLDLVSRPPGDAEQARLERETSIEIAKRLTQLQAALERLERENESTPNAP